jgi:hypothetical protein
MEVLIIDLVSSRQNGLEVLILLEVYIVLLIVLSEFFYSHIKCLRQLDGYLLLFLENEFIVCHVFLGICFQI